MATYQTGTIAITYNWANVIGNTLDAGLSSSTAFFIVDTDGNFTEVIGTGFTYNAGTTSVTGGTVTGLKRFVGGFANGELISGIALNAITFWADAGSQKLAAALSGADTFELSQTQLSGVGGTYAIDGYAGGGVKTLSEAGLTSDTLYFELNGAVEQLFDLTTGTIIPVTNINTFSGGSGETKFIFGAQPSAGALTLSGGGSLSVLEMSNLIGASDPLALLDLSTQNLTSIGQVQFGNSASGTGARFAEMFLDRSQFFVSGLSAHLAVAGDTAVSDTLDILMSTFTAFTAAGFTFDAAWQNNANNKIFIDGSASSSNLTIFAANTNSLVSGGSGNDSLQGGTGNDIFDGSIGNDTIDGGAGSNTVDYLPVNTSGLVAIIQGGSGTVNKGGANGTDHLTSIQNLSDRLAHSNGDVFEVDSAENVTANSSSFNYLIELSAGVNLAYGTNFNGISEFVSNTGANTINFATDTNFAYLYGSTGNDGLTLGAGGGYLFGEGGTNTLTGGANATNLFVGGAGGSDTMNGGSSTASNFYYVDGNDQISGAGAFNTVVELISGVTVQLGSAQYQDVQEFVSNSGANAVTVANTDSGFTYLYGGTGNDTLTTGSGGGYLIGEGGTNLLTGGGGLNVFVADSGAGVDTMNGGSGSNVYFIDANSDVHGSGAFNNVVELQLNESLVLGSAQLGTDVQQVVLNGGTNTVDFHTATSAVFLYGGAGNDTLFGGTGNDFLFGGTGTNTFEFAAGWGKDTIEDWNTGTSDLIDLTALAGSGVHATTDLTQTITSGNDAITSGHTGTNSITLMGVGAALTAGSFHFA